MATIIRITVELATLTSLILLLIAIPLSWWLARSRSLLKDVVAALTALPLALPPTVLGFYLLIALGPQGPLAALLAPFGIRTLAFTFPGLVIGSAIYSLPFAVQPIRAGFEAIGRRPLEAAENLGASPLDAFFTVVLPLARPSLLSAAILTFAHTIGEFGVVLMIGGNIPGQTRLLSIAVFDAVESMDWGTAHAVSAGMLAFAFLVVLAVQRLGRRDR